MTEEAPLYKYNKKDNTTKLMIELQESGVLKKIQDEYLYWDKIKYKHPQEVSPEDFWKAIKLQRLLKSKPIRIGKYTFSYVITDYMQWALHQFDMHFGGTLSSNIGIAETDKTKFIISSIMEEAISSSQMEGANTTRKKAKEMIRQEQKPQSRSEQMILNNFVTMKHIVQHKNEEITAESILHIHKLISNKTLDDPETEGKFRDNDEIYVANYSDGEIVHTPPSKDELDELIKELCIFCNKETDDFIHPIIKGCIIHFMIGWMHPFADGNGRTARALFYWYMLKNGYWMTEYLSISRIIKESKVQYEKAFLYTETDDNDLSYFLTYHLKTLEKAMKALKEYINLKQNEVFQAAEFMKIPNVNDRMAQILKIIHDDPDRIFNTKEIEHRFNISNFTARSDLKTLVELGFLESVQVNKKKQNFIKSKAFEKKLKSYKL